MGIIKFRMPQHCRVQLIPFVKLFEHRIHGIAEAQAQIPLIIQASPHKHGPQVHICQILFVQNARRLSGLLIPAGLLFVAAVPQHVNGHRNAGTQNGDG